MAVLVNGFSIIIPTYHEVENIPALVRHIAAVEMNDRHFEVILVDDNSMDGTQELVATLQRDYPWLRLVTRYEAKDLSQAIIRGFAEAYYPILITMDADLSHPADCIPMMLEKLNNPVIDMVVGSRYIKNGSSDKQWPLIRKVISRVAALMAKWLLHMEINDPLSGFIAFRKQMLLDGAPLTPIGWKVGLEVMLKCRCDHIVEIPIHFAQRQVGYSKLNMKTSFNYLRHVWALMRYQQSSSR